MAKINRSKGKPNSNLIARLKNEVEEEIRRQHADTEVTIVWEMPLDYVTYPTGKKGIAGNLVLSSPEFRTKTYLVDANVFGNKWRAR